MADKVYYDNDCYVCSFEINMLRKKGEACGIEFVDISNKDFEANGKDYDTEMIGEFSGKETVGAETFRQLYAKIGFHKSVKFSRLPIVRHIVDTGYSIFAYLIRPHLPKRGQK